MSNDLKNVISKSDGTGDSDVDQAKKEIEQDPESASEVREEEKADLEIKTPPRSTVVEALLYLYEDHPRRAIAIGLIATFIVFGPIWWATLRDTWWPADNFPVHIHVESAEEAIEIITKLKGDD